MYQDNNVIPSRVGGLIMGHLLLGLTLIVFAVVVLLVLFLDNLLLDGLALAWSRIPNDAKVDISSSWRGPSFSQKGLNFDEHSFNFFSTLHSRGHLRTEGADSERSLCALTTSA